MEMLGSMSDLPLKAHPSVSCHILAGVTIFGGNSLLNAIANILSDSMDGKYY